MRTEQKIKRRFIIELVVVLVLILAGLFMIASAFTSYSQVIINNQDEQLFHLAQAVDRNIESILERCEENLDYITKRRGFLEAETLWRETGETEELVFRLEENILAKDEMISSILAMNGSQVILSTNGNTAYEFLHEVGSDKIRYCTDENEKVYLAFVYDAGGNFGYAALVDLDKFYHQIVGEELAVYDWVILTDRSSDILLYHQADELRVEKADAVSSATCGQEGVNFLLKQQKEQEIGTTSYEYTEHINEKKYTARMVTIPTEASENGAFAIGVVTNFENVMDPLRGAAIRLLCYGALIAAGTMMLLRNVIRYKRRNEKDLQELKLLREKNEMMEEVNQKTREFAHHQRLQIIGSITSGVAHEFNNLLAPIMSYSLLTLEQLPEENEALADYIIEIYNASRKAKDITARLSELSRKNTATSFQKISLEEVIRKTEHVANPALPTKVFVEFDLNPEGSYIRGNETQLSQMLLNLMLNAFQAMEVNGGKLMISTAVENDCAILRVQDTGTGISPENMKNIFEPFFTTKETGKGTGLGLAIVQQVVEEHQGTIRVESEEGKGTCFIVKFPLEK